MKRLEENMERTYIMLKPDAIKRGLAGAIISRIEAKGFRIVEIKSITLSKEVLKEHYHHLIEKPFYHEIEEFMMSGPVWGMIVEGEGAVGGMRTMMGPTKIEEAPAGTIRGDFAFSTAENIIHGSDSTESANAEIQRFFGN
jgi:nucleoside-diphosphate kinase